SPRSQSWNGDQWSAQLPLSVQRESTPQELPVVLVWNGQGLRSVAHISGTWPALPDASAPAPSAAAGANSGMAASSTGADRSWSQWVLALAAALLGGVLLNLMPCVLPVLAIKLLGFARQGSDQRSAQRAQGLAYSAGVVLSFMALGATMLVLRAAGEQLGWGFQLQSPGVVASLALLFTLIGLNLAGLFELGSLLPPGLAALHARHPTLDAFLSGVLAVAIASPCTAPFMGASLGYAIGLPGTQAMAVFGALGLGLALPFLLASWAPGVVHWLPRPGHWMDSLRRFMAFPMFGTVVWLLWVIGHLSGVDGAASLLALLLWLALLVWTYQFRGRTRWALSASALALGAALLGSIGPNVLHSAETTECTDSATAAGTAAVAGALWQPWSAARVDAELAQGHPVFVDFTAAWCITCQYNKKTTLNQSAVQDDFRRHQVTLLRADWTRRDPAITQALAQLGRNGVPVYVLYQKGQAPHLFSEILGTQDLREQLAKL
ncbi:MAG: protein-disulfide reductase DsbD family protein, partial [Rhodoferax sp.]